MQFYFDSLSDFIQMGTHGPYVWASFGITWGVMAYLLLSPWLRQRRWLRQQRARFRRGQAQQAAKSGQR